MSDNGFVRLDRLKTALSRVKTKVDSDIASAISESTISLTSVINSGDASTLSEAKGYADGLKIIIDSNISSGDSSTLTSANSYTDSKISSVNSTINDLSESIPEQINLALENYTEYSDFSDHISDTANPHNVTYSQVGAAASSHTHSESDITDLGNYSVAGHTHTVNDITDSNTLATNSNLSNHTSDTSNPHSVTYSQTGAAAASHTHTEADITDLGDYASSSHSHTLANITDVTATATEVNNVINSKKNIQTQINDCRFYGFFSEWEYEKEYHLEDVIKIPCCKPFQYLECIVEGTSGYIEKLTVTNSDNENTEYLFIPYISQSFWKSSSTGTLTRTSLTLADLDMNLIPGETITDGSCVWLVQDIRDGRTIGEINYCTHSNTDSSSPYIYKNYGLYPQNTVNLYDGAYDCDIDRKSIYLKFIRLIKNSAIPIDYTMDYVKTSNNNPARFFSLVSGTMINLQNGSINTHYKLNQRHFPGLIVILDWCFNPFTYLDSEHINSIDSRVWSIINEDMHNSVYGNYYGLMNYTRSEAIDAALILKSLINTGIAHDATNSLYLNTNSLFQKFFYFYHYGRMNDPGLPNITGYLGNLIGGQSDANINSTNDSAIYWGNVSHSQRQNVSNTDSNKYGRFDPNFNASRSNSIYGNSTTVMPNSVGFHLLIKY